MNKYFNPEFSQSSAVNMCIFSHTSKYLYAKTKNVELGVPERVRNSVKCMNSSAQLLFLI